MKSVKFYQFSEIPPPEGICQKSPEVIWISREVLWIKRRKVCLLKCWQCFQTDWHALLKVYLFYLNSCLAWWKFFIVKTIFIYFFASHILSSEIRLRKCLMHISLFADYYDFMHIYTYANKKHHRPVTSVRPSVRMSVLANHWTILDQILDGWFLITLVPRSFSFVPKYPFPVWL